MSALMRTAVGRSGAHVRHNGAGVDSALAEPADGPSAQRIGAIARHSGIAIAYGYAERDAASGYIYNSVQVIGADGAALVLIPTAALNCTDG